MKIIEIVADIESELKEAVETIPQGGDFNIQTALNFVYGLMGIAAVVFIVMGGASYITAGGDPGKVRKATQTLIFAVAGLAVVLMAAAITNLIFGIVGGN